MGLTVGSVIGVGPLEGSSLGDGEGSTVSVGAEVLSWNGRRVVGDRDGRGVSVGKEEGSKDCDGAGNTVGEDGEVDGTLLGDGDGSIVSVGADVLS